MYRNQKKKGKKKERSKTSLNSLALRNARTFRLLSLRVRCISDRFFNKMILFYFKLYKVLFTLFKYDFACKIIGS